MIVVDASVIVKWFAVEPGSTEARALLRGKEELVAPELAQLEVTSALVRKALRAELASPIVRQALTTWFRIISDGQIVLVPDADHLVAASEIALQLSHPLPDCLYLAAARRLGVELLTADRKFAGIAKHSHAPIRILDARER